jgi:hypothetical protein
MYTSSGDLSSLGRAILRSTLLKPAMTRRWLKPVSFSSDPKAAVGMPWGIRRIELGQSTLTPKHYSRQSAKKEQKENRKKENPRKPDNSQTSPTNPSTPSTKPAVSAPTVPSSPSSPLSISASPSSPPVTSHQA